MIRRPGEYTGSEPSDGRDNAVASEPFAAHRSFRTLCQLHCQRKQSVVRLYIPPFQAITATNQYVSEVTVFSTHTFHYLPVSTSQLLGAFHHFAPIFFSTVQPISHDTGLLLPLFPSKLTALSVSSLPLTNFSNPHASPGNALIINTFTVGAHAMTIAR